jgi:hypothetical protein
VVVGGVALDVSQGSLPPDVVIREEDTYLVLSADTKVPDSSEHPIRTFTAVWEQKPEALGAIVRAGGRPHRLLAVVLDLSVEPATDENTVAAALKAALASADEMGAKTVGLDLLGAMHGCLSPEVALNLLRRALLATKPRSIARIELSIPENERTRIEQILAEWAGPGA